MPDKHQPPHSLDYASVINSLTSYFQRTLPVASVNVTLDGVPAVNFNVPSCILGPW